MRYSRRYLQTPRRDSATLLLRVAILGFARVCTNSDKLYRPKNTPPIIENYSSLQSFSVYMRIFDKYCNVVGKDNVITGALSRVKTLSMQLNYTKLATEQETDKELKEYLQCASYVIVGRIMCRTFLTSSFKQLAFQTICQLSHPRIKITVKLVIQRFAWPFIKVDCRAWAQV